MERPHGFPSSSRLCLTAILFELTILFAFARFYGVSLAKMLMGNRSINQMFSTREIFDAVPSVKASMPKNALGDLTACLHYSDDWNVLDDEEWDDIYDTAKVEAGESTACQ